MAVALEIDREQVKMLVLSIGVREAARRMGIPEPTVAAWSARGKWLAGMPRNMPLPKSMVPTRATNAINPAQILAASMRDDAVQGRAAALRAGRAALVRMAEKDADELLLPETADVALKWTKQHATAAGYGASDAVTRIDLRVTGDHHVADVQAPEMHEADWCDAAEMPASERVEDY